jgi:periplasmic protein TonB
MKDNCWSNSVGAATPHARAINPHFGAATLSGLGDWGDLALPGRTRGRFQLDRRRIVAISAVVVMHALLFGSMLLPAKPLATVHLPVSEVDLIFDNIKLPPPPPPPLEPPKPRVEPKIQPIAVPPIAPPLAPTTPDVVLIASIPADVPDDVPGPEIIAPDPGSGSEELGESTLRVLDAPPPPYRNTFVNKNISGTVEFSVLVGVDGRAQEIRLQHTSGNRALDQSTLAFIKRKWRFKAPERAGQPVAGWGRGKVTFKVE